MPRRHVRLRRQLPPPSKPHPSQPNGHEGEGGGFGAKSHIEQAGLRSCSRRYSAYLVEGHVKAPRCKATPIGPLSRGPGRAVVVK